MRLIACSSILPNPVEPTKGIYIFKTIRAMAEQADVSVVAPVPYFPKALRTARYARYAAVPERAVLDGVAIRYPRVLVTPGIGRSLYGVSYAACLYRPLSRLVREIRPAALLAYWAYPDGFAAAVLSRLFKLPVVIGARGGDVNDLVKGSARQRMVRWAFRRSSLVLAVSRALGSAIVSLGVDAAKVTVIPNGLDEEFVREAARPRSAGSGAQANPTILYCGRLSAEKDPMGLLEAARQVLESRPGARLVFVGAGPLKHRLEHAVAASHLEARVTLVGEVRHEQIIEHMKQADVLCLPSLTEGHPNVLLEALACGVPVVATDVGGVREIVAAPELGIVVAPGRPAELARALDQALTRRWDRQVLRDAVKGRSWRDVARETLEAVERSQ